MGAQIVPGLYAAEAEYLIEHEWATLRRRYPVAPLQAWPACGPRQRTAARRLDRSAHAACLNPERQFHLILHDQRAAQHRHRRDAELGLAQPEAAGGRQRVGRDFERGRDVDAARDAMQRDRQAQRVACAARLLRRAAAPPDSVRPPARGPACWRAYPQWRLPAPRPAGRRRARSCGTSTVISSSRKAKSARPCAGAA